jgi:hypothetical protein
MDVGPDRSSLHAMKKKQGVLKRIHSKVAWDSHTGWSSFVGKGDDQFVCQYFQGPVLEYLVGSSVQHFSDLVAIAERNEQAIHLGRIADSTEEKHFTREKKEIEVHNVKGRYKNDRKSCQNKDI